MRNQELLQQREAHAPTAERMHACRRAVAAGMMAPMVLVACSSESGNAGEAPGTTGAATEAPAPSGPAEPATEVPEPTGAAEPTEPTEVEVEEINYDELERAGGVAAAGSPAWQTTMAYLGNPVECSEAGAASICISSADENEYGEWPILNADDPILEWYRDNHADGDRVVEVEEVLYRPDDEGVRTHVWLEP